MEYETSVSAAAMLGPVFETVISLDWAIATGATAIVAHTRPKQSIARGEWVESLLFSRRSKRTRARKASNPTARQQRRKPCMAFRSRHAQARLRILSGAA